LTGITTPTVPSEPSIYSCKYSSWSSPWLIDVFFFHSDVQTLDTMQALCLPLGASVSLLVMFFFFDSMQLLFAVCTASKSFLFLYFTFLLFLGSIKWIDGLVANRRYSFLGPPFSWLHCF
jgi:signal peptide peptidase-like protein 3